MNLEDAIEPITALKTQSAKLIRKIQKTRQPVVITQNGKATAILQDIESFERERKALFLLKFLAQGDEEYRKGLILSHEEAQTKLRAKFKTLQSNG